MQTAASFFSSYNIGDSLRTVSFYHFPTVFINDIVASNLIMEEKKKKTSEPRWKTQLTTAVAKSGSRRTGYYSYNIHTTSLILLGNPKVSVNGFNDLLRSTGHSSHRHTHTHTHTHTGAHSQLNVAQLSERCAAAHIQSHTLNCVKLRRSGAAQLTVTETSRYRAALAYRIIKDRPDPKPDIYVTN